MRTRRLIIGALTASLLVTTTPTQAKVTIAAAGDIACADSPCAAQRTTTRIIRRIGPNAVLPLGDLQYKRGSLREFRRSYDRTWGRFKSRTYPVPGNHEYQTAGAAGYFDYFASRLPNRRGWYSYNLGAWHMVALNSRTGDRPSSRQLSWLRRNLQRDRHRCELAYFHHPRWSSGREHGNDPDMAAFWRVLYANGVDVVLNGHEHNYERFMKLNPKGRRSAGGIRQFVVGTGGIGIYEFGSRQHGSVVRRLAHGVLRMDLSAGSYRWRFVAARRWLDRGTAACHT